MSLVSFSECDVTFNGIFYGMFSYGLASKDDQNTLRYEKYEMLVALDKLHPCLLHSYCVFVFQRKRLKVIMWA